MTEIQPKLHKEHPVEKKQRRCQITERDWKLLRFLWKWKVSTSTALARKFFPDAKETSGHRRLISLKVGGYIQQVHFQGSQAVVWTLTDKGYKYIRPTLTCKSDGYKSENVYHDWLVAALQLGEWLCSAPEGCRTFSEQELRRNTSECYPPWVPKSDTHRSDGYSIFFSGASPVVVAFEVELSQKAISRLERVVAFYDSHSEIKRVIWLVDTASQKRSLENAFTKHHMREPSKHLFLILKDFLANGWSTKIHGTEIPLSGLFPLPNRQNLASNSPDSRVGESLALLDLRKKPINSAASAARKKGRNP